jgi:hypothetical protein
MFMSSTILQYLTVGMASFRHHTRWWQHTSKSHERASAPLYTPPAAAVDDVPVRPFPTDGVRLSHFHQFIADCGGRDALAHLTTTQVCERFVKPATARLEASYCDMLAQRQQEEPPGVVGKATVFISHAWKCVFLDVVDALLAHFNNNDDGDDVVVWFDVFSNNQHQEMAMDFDCLHLLV